VANEDDKPQFDWQLKTVVQGFFNRELLLDYIRYFVLFENDGKRLIKKIAAYHQFHAVREAVAATIVASTGKHLPLRSNISPAVKKRAWCGIPRVPAKVSPCAATPESCCNRRR
jgi:type I restriction enzyme R subunit